MTRGGDKRNDASGSLGGETPILPGGEKLRAPADAKLPLPSGPDGVPNDVLQAWRKYMIGGFRQNEEMFNRTLKAFMKPYNITVALYVVLFFVGIGFFALAVYFSLRDGASAGALVFGGLSVASFLAFFIRQPLQALEENLEFITWLGVAFNTYWTQLMYLQDRTTIQADLRAVTDDYATMVERLITKHAELRSQRPGGSEPEA